MPIILASLGGVLINLVSTLVGRALVALGFATVTYMGMSSSMNWMKDQVLDKINGMPADFVSALAFAGIGTAINILTSALMARLLLDGISGDTFKRFVMK